MPQIEFDMTAEPPHDPIVAVIGLGQMGRAIARHVTHRFGRSLVWDVAPVDAGEIGPGALRLPPREIGARADFVLFAVPGSDQIEACLTGPDGLLAAPRPGRILIDLTTSEPDRTRVLGAIAAAHDTAMIDAGMTGGAAGADAGTLTLMLGGPAGFIAAATPVLECFSARIFHIGPLGAGHTMKLIHNLVCHNVYLATAEGCRIAERVGIDLATAIDVLNAGNARSYITEVRFPRHIVSGRYDGRSRVANLAKDMGMARRLAAAQGLHAPYTHLADAILSAAMTAGLGDEDFTRLYDHASQTAGAIA